MREPVFFMEDPITEKCEECKVRGPEVSVVDERPFSKDPGSV